MIRYASKILISLMSTVCGFWLALLLRFDFDVEHILGMTGIFLSMGILVGVRHIAYSLWGIYNQRWRHTSLLELIEIAKAFAFSSAFFAAINYLLQYSHFPRSVVLIEVCLSFLISAGARVVLRQAFSGEWWRSAEKCGREIIILGGGDSGHLLVRNLIAQQKLAYRPILVLDDVERLWGTTVHGVPVGGAISFLKTALTLNPHVIAVVIAIPSLAKAKSEQIRKICGDFGVACKRLQRFEDIACLDFSVEPKHLSIESVLHTDVSISTCESVRRKLVDSTVLITGGGGSIGAEIARQVAACSPRRIVILDHCEYNLFRIDREIRDVFSSISVKSILGDIRDKRRLERVFAEESPSIVFHAAAYKHVPLMEFNAREALENNVFGTQNLLEAAAQAVIDRFVLISTDKAVDPTNAMGASKRVCEWLTEQLGNARDLQVVSVRFGNVINSNGSVVPIFREQISRGGPITVTHPEMERYFMSIPEAVNLVLTAGLEGKRGEVHALDMGKRQKVVDVAKKMRALYGRRDIEIVFTGLRPGEKLTEEVVGSDEIVVPTELNRILRVSRENQFVPDSISWINNMRKTCHSLSDDKIRDALISFANSQVRAVERLAS